MVAHSPHLPKFKGSNLFFSSSRNGDNHEQEGATVSREGVPPGVSQHWVQAPGHHHLVEERQVPAAVDLQGKIHVAINFAESVKIG